SDPPAPAGAAHVALSARYPERLGLFDGALTAQLAQIQAGPHRDAGLAVGHAAAAQILAARQNDGSGDAMPYTPGTTPADWRPTPPDFSQPATPNCGQVKPWVIASG